ncbi:MAG: hypothetical protein WCG84_03350 [Candidatus Moraniibacteriota bacterium]
MSTNPPIADPNTLSKNASSPTTPQQTNPDIALSLRTMEDDLTEMSGTKPDAVSFSTPHQVIPTPQKNQTPVSLPKPPLPTTIQPATPPEPAKPQQPAPTFQITSIQKESSPKIPGLSELFSDKKPDTSTHIIQPKRASGNNENVFEENQAGKTPLPVERMHNEPITPKEKPTPQPEISFEPPRPRPLLQEKPKAPPEKISFSPIPPVQPISIPPVAKPIPTPPKVIFPQSVSLKQTPPSVEKMPPAQQPVIVFPKWPLRVGAVVCVLLFLGGGFWYWKQTNTTPHINPDEQIIPTPIPTPTPKPAPIFNLQGTNDITITMSSSSPESFKTTLTDLSQKIKDNSIQQPVEFRVVDENNSPLTFSAWTTLMKMSFSPGILATLADPFSLFLYNDSGYVRLGLKITSNNPSQTAAILTQSEPSLLSVFFPLYFSYQPTLPTTSPSFETGSYNGISTRYINFPVPEAPFVGGLSLDYAVVNQYIVIGTSKQTTRSIIDTLTPSSTTSAVTP